MTHSLVAESPLGHFLWCFLQKDFLLRVPLAPGRGPSAGAVPVTWMRVLAACPPVDFGTFIPWELKL